MRVAADWFVSYFNGQSKKTAASVIEAAVLIGLLLGRAFPNSSLINWIFGNEYGTISGSVIQFNTLLSFSVGGMINLFFKH